VAEGRRVACYVRAAVTRRATTLRAATAAAAAVALALAAGCGGGTRQDAGEQGATYPVEVVRASFPPHQELAQHAQLQIAVRNVGDRTIPDLAATIEADGSGTSVAAFGRHVEGVGFASNSRPVWILDDGPSGGDTAASNTWALGALAPHRTRTFTWHLSAVEPGRFAITYRLFGSLTGKSQLSLRDGRAPQGTFQVAISRGATQVRVTPDGRIVRVPAR
jgi:hypothetical protein